MPMQLFGVWLTHVRLPVITALLFLAAVQINLPERALRRAVVLALMVFAVIRLGKADQAISRCDDKRAEVIGALVPLERGARLLPVMEPGAVTGDCLFSNYWHMPALAVIEKSALYPQMFVQMQPLALAADFRHLSQPQQRPARPDELNGNGRSGTPWSRMIRDRWRTGFDYLFWLHPGTRPGRVPAGLRIANEGSFFTIFKIAAPPYDQPSGAPGTK